MHTGCRPAEIREDEMLLTWLTTKGLPRPGVLLSCSPSPSLEVVSSPPPPPAAASAASAPPSESASVLLLECTRYLCAEARRKDCDSVRLKAGGATVAAVAAVAATGPCSLGARSAICCGMCGGWACCAALCSLRARLRMGAIGGGGALLMLFCPIYR